MNKIHTALAAALLALALAGCADPPQSPADPTPEPAPAEQVAHKACMVTETIDPPLGSATWTALAGLDRAQRELGAETNQVTIGAVSDYARVLQSLVDAGCDTVLGLGQDAAAAFEAAARTNPEVEFVLLDATPASAPSNLRPVLFDTHESAFLAGYLAASRTTTGTVGAFGSLSVPAVTIYLDGFVQGVEHFNAEKSAHVRLVGWDLAAQEGTFVRSNTAPAADPVAGRVAAESLTAQEADVILAVAGESGVGALELARDTGTVQIIWSDTDGCVAHADFCPQILTSVLKDYDAAVFEVIKANQEGRSAAGIFTADLGNGGTHLTADVTSPELEELTRQIIAGTIQVTSPSAIG